MKVTRLFFYYISKFTGSGTTRTAYFLVYVLFNQNGLFLYIKYRKFHLSKQGTLVNLKNKKNEKKQYSIFI